MNNYMTADDKPGRVILFMLSILSNLPGVV